MPVTRRNATRGRRAPREAERIIIIDPDEPIKPDDQLELSTAELDELLGNALYVKEPPEPHGRVIYSNKHKTFMPKKDKNTFVTLIHLKSTLLLRESLEAKTQIENELCKKPEDFAGNERNDAEENIEEEETMQLGTNDFDDKMLTAEEEEQNEEFQNPEDEMVETNEAEEMNEMDEEVKQKSLGQDSESDKESHIEKVESMESIYSSPLQKLCSVMKLKNEFNFFNRFTLTKEIHLRTKDTQTTVTKKKDFEANALLSGIYAAYTEDFTKQQEEREREKRGKIAAHLIKKNVGGSNKSHAIQNQKEHNLLKATNFLDRILNLNVTDAIAQDFRYYEDPSDEFRDKGEGTLMQMWTMTYTKENNLFVTDISWSPDYYDMFAITLAIPQGDLPFTENSDVGYVALWSLKNSSYPEYVSRTHCGALCLSFNRDHGYALAVGLRDGSLAVYNVSMTTHKPQYTTDAVNTKHTACVRQVFWCKDLSSGELNFFSVSEDGTVCQWILMKCEMIKILRMSLVIDMYPEIKQTGIKQTYYARGTMITFNPDNPDIYLVGTVEGYVFKCNTKWINYMQRFQAHQMPVNRIDYNKFNSSVYVTCSEDFTVKLWEDKSEAPLIIFDLQTNLSDVRWSPFSSTVFCVLTAVDCRAVFYDLDVSLKESVCEQLIHPASKYRLTRVAFDSRVPIVVVGSSRSTVVSFKLSPNLRTMMKAPKKGIQETTETLELEKLNNVLRTVRE